MGRGRGHPTELDFRPFSVILLAEDLWASYSLAPFVKW